MKRNFLLALLLAFPAAALSAQETHQGPWTLEECVEYALENNISVRQSEVALRMAFGSTRWGVFSRLVVEGLLILTAVTVPAALIAFNIGLAELVDVERMAFSGSRFLLALACTWVLMAVMIVLGSWYPARRAMKVQPAEALHDE